MTMSQPHSIVRVTSISCGMVSSISSSTTSRPVEDLGLRPRLDLARFRAGAVQEAANRALCVRDVAEHPRPRGAGRDTGGLEALIQAVTTERALVDRAGVLVQVARVVGT